jgi:hypothetical protein
VTIGTDWVAVGGIAELVAAGATLLLAAVTVVLASKAGKEAKATTVLATETRLDRELSFRPFFVIEERAEMDIGSHSNPVMATVFRVRNVGTGPAIDVRFIARRAGTWWLDAPLAALGPGEVSGVRRAPPQDRDLPDGLLELPQAPVDGAFFYEDVFKTRYRALVDGTTVLPEEIWRIGKIDAPPPRWAQRPMFFDAEAWLNPRR